MQPADRCLGLSHGLKTILCPPQMNGKSWKGNERKKDRETLHYLRSFHSWWFWWFHSVEIDRNLCPVAFVKCWSIIFCSLFTWQLGKLPKVCRSKVRCKHTVNFILNYCKLCKLRIKGEKTKWSKQLQQGQSTHCSFTLCDLKWPCKSCNWKDDIFRAYVILCGT